MGMTMTQKILAAHAGLSEVKAGQLIECGSGFGHWGMMSQHRLPFDEIPRCRYQDMSFDKDKVADRSRSFHPE